MATRKRLSLGAGPPALGGMPVSLRLLHWTTIVCTLSCAAVHVASFFDRAYYGVILFVPLLFVVWPFVVWQWRRVPRGNLMSQVFAAVPRWMKWTTGLLFAYVFVNYFACRSLNQGGLPTVLADKRLVLQSGQQILQVLNPAQFAHAQAVQVRLLSGHLMVFYALAWIALRAFWLKSGTAMADAEVKGR